MDALLFSLIFKIAVVSKIWLNNATNFRQMVFLKNSEILF
jgi:hypothetical protein